MGMYYNMCSFITENGELLRWGLAGGKVVETPTRATFITETGLDSVAELLNLNITSVRLGGYHLMALDCKYG